MTATGGTIRLDAHRRLRHDDRISERHALGVSVRLEREPRGRNAAAVVAGRRRAVQPDRRARGATPGLYNGVMLARINTDIALADFEASVRNLVSDVEIAYWELYFEYRSLDAVIAGRDSALATWRKIYTLYTLGAQGRRGGEGGPGPRAVLPLPQHGRTDRSTSLYVTEAKLRYLMGLAATDGRLIRPKDEPTTAKVTFDWCEVLNEGLARSVELRQEKWIVKRRELELIAAKNFLLPKLDFVAQYRWLGLGNRLDRGQRAGHRTATSGPPPDSNAYRTLDQRAVPGMADGIPGATCRWASAARWPACATPNWQLAKERVKLQEGELELSHQLAYAIRDLETNYVLEPDGLQPPHRRPAAGRGGGRGLRNRAPSRSTSSCRPSRTLAQAESDYYRSLVELQQVDRPGPLPQGLAAGVQWGILGRRAVAGQGVLRRPPPRPGPRRLDVSRLRLHAAEGHQPRADRAAGRRQRLAPVERRRAARRRRPAPADSRNWCRRPSREPMQPVGAVAAEPAPPAARRPSRRRRHRHAASAG